MKTLTSLNKTGIKQIVFEEILNYAEQAGLVFDVVDLNKPVQQKLLDSIEKEGIILYEKASKYLNKEFLKNTAIY